MGELDIRLLVGVGTSYGPHTKQKALLDKIAYGLKSCSRLTLLLSQLSL